MKCLTSDPKRTSALMCTQYSTSSKPGTLFSAFVAPASTLSTLTLSQARQIRETEQPGALHTGPGFCSPARHTRSASSASAGGHARPEPAVRASAHGAQK